MNKCWEQDGDTEPASFRMKLNSNSIQLITLRSCSTHPMDTASQFFPACLTDNYELHNISKISMSKSKTLPRWPLHCSPQLDRRKLHKWVQGDPLSPRQAADSPIGRVT